MLELEQLQVSTADSPRSDGYAAQDGHVHAQVTLMNSSGDGSGSAHVGAGDATAVSPQAAGTGTGGGSGDDGGSNGQAHVAGGGAAAPDTDAAQSLTAQVRLLTQQLGVRTLCHPRADRSGSFRR